ncbi:MAG: formylglycine-generating enzyme family protein [Anaerolineales bacterium]
MLRQGAFTDKVTAHVLDQFVYGSASIPEIESPIQAGRDIVGRDKAVMSEVARVTRVITLGSVEFVEIPAGKFLMGSRADDPNASDGEKPQHTVEITRPYRIGHYPVTNAQYRAFAEAEKTKWKTKSLDDHPAVNVSWEDAVAFCKWLTAQHKAELPQGTVFRLPTEAECEKAARGEYGNEYPWGNEWDPKKCNTGEGGPGTTTPVGAYSLAGDSPYGVADMAGNVWEWCADWSNDTEYQRRAGKEVKDPTGPASGVFHALRGGAWSFDRDYARCACRNGDDPVDRNSVLGFRVVAASPVSR